MKGFEPSTPRSRTCGESTWTQLSARTNSNQNHDSTQPNTIEGIRIDGPLYRTWAWGRRDTPGCVVLSQGEDRSIPVAVRDQENVSGASDGANRFINLRNGCIGRNRSGYRLERVRR